jgi:hypothetical protein
MKKLIFILSLFVNLFLFSQVTLLSPTGDGGFETGATALANGWTATIGTSTQNQWIVGSAYAYGGSRGAYITNATSTAPNAYTMTTTRVTHLYRNFTIPTNAATATLSFYWKGTGETYLGTPTDYMSVYFEPATNAAPVYGTQKALSGTAPTGIIDAAGGATTRTRYNLQSTSQLVTINIPTTYFTNTTYRLTFEWRNDGSAGTNPPAAIDNVSITYTVVSTVPTCASLSAPSNGATDRPLTQTITWASTATATGYDVYFGTSATPPLVSSNQAGTTYNPGTLNANTTYYHKIVPRNSVGPATGCNTWSFTTLNPPSNDNCSGATSLPCGTSSLAGTTVNAVSETAPNSSTTGTMGVWYTFVGDGQSTTITVVQSLDTRLLVLTSGTGSCGGTYTTVANVDNITSTNETTTFTAINGTVYFIYIGHWNSTTTTGTFTISRTCVTPPSNNNCSSAPSLTVNSGTSCTSPTNGTTVGATQSSTSCAGTADDDVWYSFVATQTSQIITVTPGTMSDAVFQVYSGTCSGLTSLACIDNTLGSSSETTTVTSLTIGSTYYVRVHSYGNGTGQGTFSICATSPCSTPTTSGTLTANLYSTTVNDAVTFTTTGNGGTITLFEWSYNNFTSIAGSTTNPANPYTLILNVQQPTIWFRTTSTSGTCPVGVTSPVSVTLQSAPPYVYGTDDGDYISNVTLNTINNNSTYDLPLGDSYQDFTSISTTLIRGANYTIFVSSPVTFLGSASGYVAWIDFDNDGIFEVSENIMQKSPSTTQSQSFTVPSDAATGLVKMRVLSRWNGTPTTDAYNSAGYNYGEVEEYRVSIESALPIELTSFNGFNKGKNNHIFWVTSSEQNTSHFNLQKSRDGETWETVVTLNAAGNSNTQIDYDVVDYKVDPIINYYRLQQYDNDGVYETFGPISINNTDLGNQKTIVKYINLNGQEIDPNRLNLMDVYIEVYSDGTIKKIIK